MEKNSGASVDVGRIFFHGMLQALGSHQPSIWKKAKHFMICEPKKLGLNLFEILLLVCFSKRLKVICGLHIEISRLTIKQKSLTNTAELSVVFEYSGFKRAEFYVFCSDYGLFVIIWCPKHST